MNIIDGKVHVTPQPRAGMCDLTPRTAYESWQYWCKISGMAGEAEWGVRRSCWKTVFKNESKDLLRHSLYRRKGCSEI
jgi:hypothetical protein